MNYKIEGAIKRNRKNFIIFAILWLFIAIVFVAPVTYSWHMANISGKLDLTVFIKGDLLNENNEVNTNYLNDENEIVILSGLKELTVKIFGSSSNDIEFFVQKINQKQLLASENKRDNQIFELEMTEEDNIKYVLGTYDYETYAYGENPVNYYVTYDSGEFERNTL